MAKKKQLIIPIFIPHHGCPHQCVFCNQSRITGKSSIPDAADVTATIHSYLKTWKGSGKKEIAFYGGSFTGLPQDAQERFLHIAHGFAASGLIDSLRVSTRPDYINSGILALLKRFKVETVELGVQSMVDEVLRLSGRGHTSKDTEGAVLLLRNHGFKIGLQLMPGLPGDSSESILYSAKKAIELKPDFVRIYPTLVVRDTPLEDMYKKGIYKPWNLQEMTDVCRKLVPVFRENRIPIIRLGLQQTDFLEHSIVAGPYHPSFGSLIAGNA